MVVFVVPAAIVFGAAQTPAAVPGEAGWDQPWFHLALGTAAVVLLGLCRVGRCAPEPSGNCGLTMGCPGRVLPEPRRLPTDGRANWVSTPGSGYATPAAIPWPTRAAGRRISGTSTATASLPTVTIPSRWSRTGWEVTPRATWRAKLLSTSSHRPTGRRAVCETASSRRSTGKRGHREGGGSGRGALRNGNNHVAAAVTEQGLYWISVGDSPLYLFRAGRLER